MTAGVVWKREMENENKEERKNLKIIQTCHNLIER